MRVICAYSGMEFTLPQFRMTVKGAVHPLFLAPQSTLLAQLRAFTAGELTDPEKILLFLALANSTGLVRWESPAFINDASVRYANNHMDRMAAVTYRINEIKHADSKLPHFRCANTGDANTLGAFVGALADWEAGIAEFAAAHADAVKGQKLLRIEETLARMVRLQKRSPLAYAKAISKWAAGAGDFPQFRITLPDGTETTCAEYWTQIIFTIASNGPIESINAGDLLDIIDHCEAEVPHGSIFAASLMRTLRDGLKRYREFMGLPCTAGSKYFTLLPATPAEQANREQELAIVKRMAESATAEAPKREDFKDVMLFLRAQANFRAKQALAKQQAEEENVAKEMQLTAEFGVPDDDDADDAEQEQEQEADDE